MDATTDRKSQQGPSQSALSVRMVRENANGAILSIDDKRTASLDAHQPGIESGASIASKTMKTIDTETQPNWKLCAELAAAFLASLPKGWLAKTNANIGLLIDFHSEYKKAQSEALN